MKELMDIFLTFARIGGFTFGGGYAMLPMLEKELVANKKWTTKEEILDYYAVAQCTPGVIAVNTATFIGYKRRGIWGAIFATAGVVFPSLVIILVIASVLNQFKDLVIVQKAFAGLRVCVAALVVNAVVKLWKTGIKDFVGIIIFALTFTLTLIFNLSPVYIVIAAMLMGIFVKKAGGRK